MSMTGHATESAQQAVGDHHQQWFLAGYRPNEYREEERVAGVTDARIRQSLRAAVADINRQLANFQHQQQQAGRMAWDAIPPEPWQSPGDVQLLYTRAVYAQAQADLHERYRDYSATGESRLRAETIETAADDYRADARWAVAELTGRNHTTVELI